MKRNTYHGAPCRKAGHTERYKSSRTCVVCTREQKRRRYAKDEKYRKARKEKNKKYYWENREKCLNYARSPHVRQNAAVFRRKYRNQTTVPMIPKPELCEWRDCSRPALHEDHCKTGPFRGFLCPSHNQLLGRMGDSKEGVEKTCSDALEYLAMSLKRHKEYEWLQ